MLGRTMSQILLQVTQDCNFRCEYCVYTASIDGVQRKHQNKHMSWDTAKRAVDYLWEHSIDSDVITIGFYGGEPLLEYSLIQKVISYSDKRFAGKQIHYAMTTNASLLSIEKARYLYDHHVHLILSIDGPAEIHNANRPFKNSNCGSYSVVLNNITQLKKELPEYINEIELNMVIDPQSNLDEIYSILNEGGDFYGFKAMATIINDLSLKKKNNRTQDFSIQLEYQTFLLLLKELGLVKINAHFPLSEITVETAKKALEKKYEPTSQLPESASPGGMCVPGVHKLFVTADERLITCERVNEPSDAGFLGTLTDGIDVARAEKILNLAELTKQECRECWAFRYCYNCLSHCDDGNCASRSLRLEHCKNAKQSVGYVFQIMLLLLQKEELFSYRVKNDEENTVIPLHEKGIASCSILE